MEKMKFDEKRELDIIFIGRITIDFNPAYANDIKEEFKPLKNVHLEDHLQTLPSELQSMG